MPVVRAKAGAWGSLFGALFPLWIDPERKKKWQLTAGDIEGHAIYAVKKKFPDKVALTEKDLKKIHGTSPTGTRLPGNFQSNIGQGMIAGAILFSVLRIANFQERDASIEKALRIVSHWCKEQGLASGRASLLHAWGRYRDLSPYFAAIFLEPRVFFIIPQMIGLSVSKRAVASSPDNELPLTAKTMEPMLNDLPRFVEGMQKLATEVIPRYFAVANRLRELGELHCAPGQRVRERPLLDKKTTWKIPRGFKLPHVKITFKRLTKAERIALSSRVKSKL